MKALDHYGFQAVSDVNGYCQRANRKSKWLASGQYRAYSPPFFFLNLAFVIDYMNHL